MKVRNKLTVIGAVGLAASAIGGGAFVTSRAMADGVPPTTGTLTVISVKAGDDSAVKCTYNDIALPTGPPAGEPAIAHSAPTFGTGTALAGSGPGFGTADASTVSDAYPVVWGNDVHPGDAPQLSDRPLLDAEGSPILTLDSSNVREGTPEECAAMRPVTGIAPFGSTGVGTAASGTAVTGGAGDWVTTDPVTTAGS